MSWAAIGLPRLQPRDLDRIPTNPLRTSSSPQSTLPLGATDAQWDSGERSTDTLHARDEFFKSFADEPNHSLIAESHLKSKSRHDIAVNTSDNLSEWSTGVSGRGDPTDDLEESLLDEDFIESLLGR